MHSKTGKWVLIPFIMFVASFILYNISPYMGENAEFFMGLVPFLGIVGLLGMLIFCVVRLIYITTYKVALYKKTKDYIDENYSSTITCEPILKESSPFYRYLDCMVEGIAYIHGTIDGVRFTSQFVSLYTEDLTAYLSRTRVARKHKFQGYVIQWGNALEHEKYISAKYIEYYSPEEAIELAKCAVSGRDYQGISFRE